ncbi:MAG: hypothetical protein IIZ78_03015 [Clostridiales bacterium]|nr:hypothetical protein [Clostridiales bacterium]
MTAKEYLEQIESLSIRIDQMQNRLDCMRETAGGAAAIRYDKDRVQASVTVDAVERNVLQLIEMEEKIFSEKVRLETIRNKITEQIQALDDDRYVKILYKRYVEGKKFYMIHEETDYDYDYVRVLHGEALGYFEMIYRKDFVEF